MPVPQARILNPFVPRDDLGIEEDISTRLYLPSDVSLSLATMVGRNGRKPRIVQMDDDGSIFIARSPTRSAYSGLQFTNLLNNQVIGPAFDLGFMDVRKYNLIKFVIFVVSTVPAGNSVNFSVDSYMLDKTSLISSDHLSINEGQGTMLVFEPGQFDSLHSVTIDPNFYLPGGVAGAVVNLDAYYF